MLAEAAEMPSLRASSVVVQPIVGYRVGGGLAWLSASNVASGIKLRRYVA